MVSCFFNILTYFNIYINEVSELIAHGIDVSRFQGIIDWEVVKNHIDFAIIRCGYGGDSKSQDDPLFRRNADECTRLNIPFGIYLYSYATNVEEAKSEAMHALRLAKDYKLAYPVYYDLEDNNTTGRQSNETIGEIAKTFGDILEKENYYVGIYASLFWFRTKLTSPVFDEYTKWIARYNDELNYDGEYGMWQYSATGRVQGIEGMVDLDYSYKDFPTIIEEGGFNNFSNENMTRYKVGDEVEFHYVFFTSESTTPLRPYRTIGRITRIVPGARNPYLIGEDAGWVNDQVIERQIKYLSAPDYTGNSLTDALRSINEDTSFANRAKLAKLNGINNYQGTQSQNDQLLALLKKGQLVA